MALVVFVLVAAGGLFWLAYRRPRPRRWLLPRPAALARRGSPAAPAAGPGSPVDRQHRHLHDGGLIGETTFEATKARLRELLAAGRSAEVEGGLRAGLDFAVQVRALAEIGTPEAGLVLERQLARTLSRDPVEQAWYWVDVTAGLRKLNRASALPAVLRCADVAAGLPQGVVLSAEAVAFPNFPAALNDLASPTGRSALRALARSARGGRDLAVDPAALVRAGLGDHLATVSETAPPSPDPWLTAAVLEAERVSRRLEHWARLLPHERPAIDRQARRLGISAARRREWLASATRRLVAAFPAAPAEDQAASLRYLDDIGADVTRLFPALPDRRAAWWADAVRCLTWAKGRKVGPALAELAARLLGSRRGGPAAVVVLAALRGHRSPQAEAVLLKAAGSRHDSVRRAALGSLGWWDPFDPAGVVAALQSGRGSADHGVRRAAVGALARLGERDAVGEFAEGLAAEEPAARQAAALAAADEGLTWLWPDLQALADGPDPDTALAAAEALERMRERLLGPLG